MGTLRYANESYEIEDRVLAHVKAAVGAKLRRHESFYLSWDSAVEHARRVTLWLSPSSHIEFHFDEPVPPTLNREWVEQLTRSSHSLRGMLIIPEHSAPDIQENEGERQAS